MTRVEKFRQYREEIANMKFDSLSEKTQTAKKVENVHGLANESKLNYEQVMSVQESLGEKNISFKRKRIINLTKYEIFYFLVAFLIVIILSVFLVITGIKLWR